MEEQFVRQDVPVPSQGEGGSNVLKNLLLIGLVGLAVAGALWILSNWQRVSGFAAGISEATLPAPSSEDELRNVIERVSKHLIIPNETPILATIADAEALRETQPFYKDVSDGDILLIYQSQARAILYNPNKDILVNVGVVQTGDGTTPAESPGSGGE